MTLYLQLHKGTGLFSRLIRWQTRSPYSHASVWFYEAADPDGGVVIESMEGVGVRSIPAIGYRDARQSGTIMLYRVPSLTDGQIAKIRSFMEGQIGLKYDWAAVFKFVTRRKHAHDDKWFCSELVFAAFKEAGVTLLNGTEAWAVWPGQLAHSPLVVRA
jgi:uncharacterized protein YycO